MATIAVYPRTRGATDLLPEWNGYNSGLSPHARGNPQRPGARCRQRGSIPARAGQPGCRCLPSARLRVYPRTRGATAPSDSVPQPRTGLSPHARGNRGRSGGGRRCQRSIPARAGQPLLMASCTVHRRVYPRTRGATTAPLAGLITLAGLSPHARGNLPFVHLRTSCDRSIPARAGQPGQHGGKPGHYKVYPRTRGATVMSVAETAVIGGLSPHARGNRRRSQKGLALFRSIPARAGQPGWFGRGVKANRVYPRTRGATGSSPWCRRPGTGLSPHARGNLSMLGIGAPFYGSIPARAGQPGRSS